MAQKIMTPEDVADAFVKLREELTSTDSLRAAGIPDALVQRIETIMRREGLDPKRGAHVREMLDGMAEAAYVHLLRGPRLN